MLQLCWDFKSFGEPGSKFYYWKFFPTHQIFDVLVPKLFFFFLSDIQWCILFFLFFISDLKRDNIKYVLYIACIIIFLFVPFRFFCLLTPAVDSVFNENTWITHFQSVTCLISPCSLLPCSYYTGLMAIVSHFPYLIFCAYLLWSDTLRLRQAGICLELNPIMMIRWVIRARKVIRKSG